jgi:hypothetical protein
MWLRPGLRAFTPVGRFWPDLAVLFILGANLTECVLSTRCCRSASSLSFRPSARQQIFGAKAETAAGSYESTHFEMQN